ncbi:hypothetical protein CsNV_074 [Callinectes sapidus nudivirus]|nr:hypothetical protein CsNV_074 [Callinectes sapidus nudivirus]
MFVDQLSYAFVANGRINRKAFDFSKLRIGPPSIKLVLYKSDNSGFYSAHYDFELTRHKTYKINSIKHYTNVKDAGRKYLYIGLKTYVQLLKKMKKCIICIGNLNENSQYPFHLIDKKEGIIRSSKIDVEGLPIYAQKLNIYMYSVPVHDIFEKITFENELFGILNYLGYSKDDRSVKATNDQRRRSDSISGSDSEAEEEREIARLVKYIDGK